MKIMFLVIALCFLASLSSIVFAQTCDSPKASEETRVYFVNGMFTEPREAEDGQIALIAALGPSYSVGLSYNEYEDGLAQFVEVFRQRTNEPRLFWRWLANLDIAPSWFKRDFANYVVGHANLEYSSDLDLRKMIDQYLRDLRSGIKVILVSHSQGNFYAYNAYQYIALTQSEYANSISIVSVGTPSGAVLAGGTWHSNSLDRVLQVVDTFYSVLPANFTFSDPQDSLNHGFITTYLTARGSLIRNDVLQLASQLEAPIKHPQCDPNCCY